MIGNSATSPLSTAPAGQRIPPWAERAKGRTPTWWGAVDVAGSGTVRIAVADPGIGLGELAGRLADGARWRTLIGIGCLLALAGGLWVLLARDLPALWCAIAVALIASGTYCIATPRVAAARSVIGPQAWGIVWYLDSLPAAQDSHRGSVRRLLHAVAQAESIPGPRSAGIQWALDRIAVAGGGRAELSEIQLDARAVGIRCAIAEHWRQQKQGPIV